MKWPAVLAMLVPVISSVGVLAYDDAPAPGRSAREEMRLLKDCDGMKCRTVYPCLVSNWTLPVLALGTNGLQVSSLTETDAHVKRLSLFVGNNLLVGVRGRMCGSAATARSRLCGHVDAMAMPRAWQCATNDIGDVAFTQVLTEQSHVVFCRNNVFIVVDSWMSSNNATNIARQIDASILRASGVEVE